MKNLSMNFFQRKTRRIWRRQSLLYPEDLLLLLLYCSSNVRQRRTCCRFRIARSRNEDGRKSRSKSPCVSRVLSEAAMSKIAAATIEGRNVPTLMHS